MSAQPDELEKLWSVIADHQLVLPALGVAAVALVVWAVLRALHRGSP